MRDVAAMSAYPGASPIVNAPQLVQSRTPVNPQSAPPPPPKPEAPKPAKRVSLMSMLNPEPEEEKPKRQEPERAQTTHPTHSYGPPTQAHPSNPVHPQEHIPSHHDTRPFLHHCARPRHFNFVLSTAQSTSALVKGHGKPGPNTPSSSRETPD